ncbi:MAG: hypothetical protein SGJ09_15345 [Phycisphaerae bacterium]|nr:hypothetical protein [Phycisphaerae bacterium]
MNVASAPDICRAVLESVTPSGTDELIVLSIPSTAYRLHFKLAGRVTTVVGKRITGTIRGKAMRIHPASAGGQFIEPVDGHPRIVQGVVVTVDAAANRLLIDMAVPAWIVVAEGQLASDFVVGQTVNMYVESGMTFTPA